MTKKQAEIFHEKEWQKAEARALSAERRLQHAMKRLGGVWDSMMTDGLLPNMRTDPRRYGKILSHETKLTKR